MILQFQENKDLQGVPQSMYQPSTGTKRKSREKNPLNQKMWTYK